MRLRVFCVAAFAALWVTSCGNQTAAGPSASPSPFEFKGTPSTLVLRETDLPAGFRVHYESAEGVYGVADLLTTDTATSAVAADALLKRGLGSSYARSFDSDGSKNKGIASIVMLYRDASNAREAVSLLFGYARDIGCYEIPIAGTIGETAKACAALVTYPDNTRGSVWYLFFSIANAVAYIGIADDLTADDGNLIAELATTQVRLMRSFGGADLKVK